MPASIIQAVKTGQKQHTVSKGDHQSDFEFKDITKGTLCYNTSNIKLKLTVNEAV